MAIEEDRLQKEMAACFQRMRLRTSHVPSAARGFSATSALVFADGTELAALVGVCR
jgi:hypothetical protein